MKRRSRGLQNSKRSSIFFPKRKKESLLLFTARLLSLPRARVETNLSLSTGSHALARVCGALRLRPRVCICVMFIDQEEKRDTFFFEKLFPLFFFSSSFHLGFFNFFSLVNASKPHSSFAPSRARLCELERDDARELKRRRRTRRKKKNARTAWLIVFLRERARVLC